MPCLAVIHLRGRGPVGNGDWEANDIVQVFNARKRGGILEAFIGNVWKTDLGIDGSKEFLALYVPNLAITEGYGKAGRAVSNVSWESHFTQTEKDKILDRTKTVSFQGKPGIAKDILMPRVRRDSL